MLFLLAFSGACIGGPRVSLSFSCYPYAPLDREHRSSPPLHLTLSSLPPKRSWFDDENVDRACMDLVGDHNALSSCCYCFSPVIDRTNVCQPTANWIRSHQGSHSHLVGRYVEYKSDHVSSVLERYRLSGCYRHHKWYFQLLQLHSSVKPFVQHRRTPRGSTSRRHSWHSCPLE